MKNLVFAAASAAIALLVSGCSSFLYHTSVLTGYSVPAIYPGIRYCAEYSNNVEEIDCWEYEKKNPFFWLQLPFVLCVELAVDTICLLPDCLMSPFGDVSGCDLIVGERQISLPPLLMRLASESDKLGVHASICVHEGHVVIVGHNSRCDWVRDRYGIIERRVELELLPPIYRSDFFYRSRETSWRNVNPPPEMKIPVYISDFDFSNIRKGTIVFKGSLNYIVEIEHGAVVRISPCEVEKDSDPLPRASTQSR